MRTALPVHGRPAAVVREKAPPPASVDWLYGSHGPVERPRTLRDAIIRWLNEEL